MNIIFELLIIIAISIFWSFFAALILCNGKDKHYFIRTNGIEKDHYILKKSIFLFAPAFAMTRNWKTGIIRKDTFWSLIGLYLYQLCFFVADLVYYLITQGNMVYEKPIIFVILAILPLPTLIIMCGITAIIIYKKDKKQ